MKDSYISRRDFLKRSSLTGLGIAAGLEMTSPVHAEIPLNKPQESQEKKEEPEPALKVSLFDIDATPPVGSQLAYVPMIASWDLSLRAKGLVITGAGSPLVICAIDWIEICNESYDAFKEALAEGARTTLDRVTVHTLHQHDSVYTDFSAEKIIVANHQNPGCFESTFQRAFLEKLSKAVADCLKTTTPITHLGCGRAEVHRVASTRRIFNPDGSFKTTRFSACKDPEVQAAPVGLIDPNVDSISLWNNETPVVEMTFYATHPQSYYRVGIANPDFVGVARTMRQLAVPEAMHIHFNGAGGNVSAGKFNDGSKINRLILGQRLAEGMKNAWENVEKVPITAEDVKWKVEKVAFKPSLYMPELEKQLKENPKMYGDDTLNGHKMAFYQRCKDGKKLDFECLTIKNARILFLPAEMCIEFQLAAKAERPDLFVTMAAYGDCGPAYICPTHAFNEGGYEVSQTANNTAPDTEKVVLAGIHALLQD